MPEDLETEIEQPRDEVRMLRGAVESLDSTADALAELLRLLLQDLQAKRDEK
jgi:hypothetical protein